VIYEDLQIYEAYIKCRIEWLKENFKGILDKDLHESELDKQVQGIYRDCLVLSRRIEKATKRYPYYMPVELKNDIIDSFKLLRHETIPQFINFVDINKK
jgi:hypothetical protein